MKKTIYSLFFLLCAVMFSCQQDSEETNTIKEISNDIIAKLNAAGFDTSEGFKKYKGGYLVEYDIYLTEKMINELATFKPKAKNARIEHFRTDNLVSGNPRIIRVFIDPSLGSWMLSAFDIALARYNNLHLCLTFQKTTNASAADIKIESYYENGGPLGYSTGFPSGGNPSSPIRLNTYYFNNNSNRADAITVITHEIGHAIGFRHTDYMNRRFSCGGDKQGSDEGSGGDGAVHVPGTPTGPSSESWMLACSGGNDRAFTTDDIISLTTVYTRGYWSQIGGSGRKLAIGANGDVYALGLGDAIYNLGNNGWNLVSNTPAKDIAVQANGTLWIVDAYNNFYTWANDGWNRIPGSGRKIAMGANGDVYSLGLGNDIYMLGDDGWNLLSNTGAKDIAVQSNGTLWIIDNYNNFYTWGNGGWNRIPGSGKKIAMGKNGGICMIGLDNIVYRWGSNNNWNPVSISEANEIAVDETGLPWIADSYNYFYKWTE